MIVQLVLYSILIIKVITNNDDDEHFHQHIPFFVMQPHTIINQTLHSYCQEQFEFNIQPMFINLTEWPSGFIYARNPQQKFDTDYDITTLSIQECTTQLQAAHGERIRIVFYPIAYMRNDYDQDYFMSIPKTPCLRIRDIYETTTFDCPMMVDKSKSTLFNRHSEDYLSNSNIIHLEVIQPPRFITDYDDTYHQFKLFFTTFTSKSQGDSNNNLFVCPGKHLFDCDDAYCVHINARCNGITECRSKIDEESCQDEISNGISVYHVSSFIINVKCLFIFLILSPF